MCQYSHLTHIVTHALARVRHPYCTHARHTVSSAAAVPDPPLRSYTGALYRQLCVGVSCVAHQAYRTKSTSDAAMITMPMMRHVVALAVEPM